MALEAVDWLLQLRVRAEAIRSTPGLLLYLAMECCVTEKENGSHHSGTTVLPPNHCGALTVVCSLWCDRFSGTRCQQETRLATRAVRCGCKGLRTGIAASFCRCWVLRQCQVLVRFKPALTDSICVCQRSHMLSPLGATP